MAGSLRYDFEVYSPSQLVATGSSTVTSPAAGSWTIPAGALVNGGAYSYRVRVYDGVDFSGYSDDFAFQVDTTPVAPPGISSSVFVSNQWAPHGSTGTITLSDAADDTTEYWFNLDGVITGWVQPNDNASYTFTPPPLSDGVHSITVGAADDAGNSNWSGMTFGVGAGLITPHDQAQTARFTNLASAAPADHPYLTYQLRAGTTNAFAPMNTANVTLPGTSNHPTWPQTGAISGATATFANLTLDAQAALGSDGVLQLRGCFATDTAGSNTLCSQPTTLVVAQQTPSSGALQLSARARLISRRVISPPTRPTSRSPAERGRSAWGGACRLWSRTRPSRGRRGCLARDGSPAWTGQARVPRLSASPTIPPTVTSS